MENALSPHEAYAQHLFTSACCHQFVIHDGTTFRCGCCQRVITQINDNESVTINVKFNNASGNNVSNDVQNAFKRIARRFSTDPTYELCAIKCPKCGSLSRYARDQQGIMFYICSNAKCRNVFDAPDD